MQGHTVDERDSRWERHEARYRLFTYGGPTRATDITGVSVTEALGVGAIAGKEMIWSLALVVDDSEDGRGLVWLTGMDYTDRPSTREQWRARAEMQDRWLSRRPMSPPTLPNGLRVIRLFCDHGREWPLWESFSAGYTLDAADLGLSAGLSERLHAWNDEYLRNALDGDLGPQWITEGRRLHALLQGELAGIAEVRPDFL
jgi:hypothetical protein